MEFYPGGMGTLFREIIQIFDLNAKLIQTVTGFNPLVMGGTPDKEDPVTLNLMSAKATQDTIKPLMTEWFCGRKKGAEGVSRMIQVLIQFNEDSKRAYEEIVDKFGIIVIEASLTENQRLAGPRASASIDLGIAMQARPNDLTRQSILDASKSAMQPGKDGQQVWGMEDNLLIIEMLDSKRPTKVIQWTFARLLERKKKEAAKASAQNTKIQNDAIMAQNKQKADIEKAQSDDEFNKKMKLLDKEGEITLQKTALQESLRKEKEENKERIKKGEEETEPVTH